MPCLDMFSCPGYLAQSKLLHVKLDKHQAACQAVVGIQRYKE